MDFCRFCLVVCFLSLPNIGLVENFDFDVCQSSQRKEIEVSYLSNGALMPPSLNIECGQSYLLKDVTSIPTIRFAAAEKKRFYEVLMFDPDAPSAANPRCRSWLHLMMSNVLGCDLSSGISPKNPLAIKEYNPPSPPKGSGYHRYIVATYSHEKPLQLHSPSQRCGFDIDGFATFNNLSKIPDATNMFKTKTP